MENPVSVSKIKVNPKTLCTIAVPIFIDGHTIENIKKKAHISGLFVYCDFKGNPEAIGKEPFDTGKNYFMASVNGKKQVVNYVLVTLSINVDMYKYWLTEINTKPFNKRTDYIEHCTTYYVRQLNHQFIYETAD